MKNPAVRSRCGSVSTSLLVGGGEAGWGRGPDGDPALRPPAGADIANVGSSAARSSRLKSRLRSRKAAIRRSFSVGEIVQVE
jgi:hypothetical protein